MPITGLERKAYPRVIWEAMPYPPEDITPAKGETFTRVLERMGDTDPLFRFLMELSREGTTQRKYLWALEAAISELRTIHEKLYKEWKDEKANRR